MSRWIDERIKINTIDDIRTSSTRLPMEKLQIQYVAETFLLILSKTSEIFQVIKLSDKSRLSFIKFAWQSTR